LPTREVLKKTSDNSVINSSVGKTGARTGIKVSSTINAPLISSDAIDDNILTLDGTAPAGSTVALFFGTTDIGTAAVDAEGDWTFTTGTLADGSYSLTATDSISGNTSAASPVLNIVVDSPVVPVIDSGALNSSFEEVLVGTATANTTVAVFEGTTELGTAAVSNNGAWSFTTAALSSGDYSFAAADVDAAANTSPASSTVTQMVNTTPATSSYFGLTIESYDYNYSYLGGPVEAFPTIPVGVVRSWDVWSPDNGQIEYLDWNSLNPAAGVYNWTALDSWIAANQANNTPMVYTFGDPPAWAGGTAINLTDFQAFVTAVVTQANGAIKYWEGFNEFDVSGVSPALMVQLQEIVYNTVHTLDPGALVLSPTVSGAWSDSTFGQFLADGGGNYFDIAAFHGYNNSTGEGIVPVVQDFQAVLSQYGLSNVPIWDTEWGMESPTAITDPTAQEAYVSTGLILQAAMGVQAEIFYAYDNANSALYNTATGQLTAAGVAYEVTAQWLAGAVEPSGYQVNGSIYTVQLVKNGQSDLLVWNDSGQSSYATGTYTQYIDAQGVIHTITNGTVTIGTVPILLETPVTSAPPQAPQITSFSPDSATVGNAITNATVLTLTGTGEANSTVTVFDGSTQLGTAAVNAGGVWSFVTGTLANGAQVFTATDSDAGNVSAASAALTVTIDTTAPTVASLVASGTGISSGSGDLDAGKTVTLTLAMSEAVTVAGGTPTLTLNDGGTATYSGGSGTSALTFSYTVAAGQNMPDLAVTAVNLNTATVTDAAGNAANLAGAVTNPSGTLQIDTIVPTAPVIASDAVNSNNTVSLSGTAEAYSTVTLYDGKTELGTATANGSGAWSYTTGTLANGAQVLTATATDAAGNTSAPSITIDPIIGQTTAPTVSSLVASGTSINSGSGDLDAGKTVTLTLAMSEAVTVAGGTPTLTLNDGGTASYTGGSGTSALTFSYTVAAGQNTPDLTVTAVNLGSASITDAAGNAANLAGAATNPAGTLQIGTTAPTVSLLVASGTSINSGSGDLDAGKTVTLTLAMSEAVTVAGGTPTLTLNDGGTASYTGGSGTSALTFSYTVAAGQNTPDLAVTAVNLNAANVTDAAGNPANLSGALTNPSGTLQIDTTAPTVASLVASGTGISSGSGDLDAGKTVTLTLAMSEAVTVAGGTPTLTLNDGATATYSGGSDTSALTFSYTVAAGQNTPDLAVTAVNLNTATVTDAAGNAANLAGAVTNPAGTLQIDTTAPVAPVIVNYTLNSNNTVSLSGSAEANSTIKVYDRQTALGTTTASVSGAWSYTTGTLANGTQVLTATATDAAGNTGAASTPLDPNIGGVTELTGIQSGSRSVANGTTLDITGTVDNAGAITLSASGKGADLVVVAAATLTGAGKVTLSNNAGNEIGSNGASATLTNGNNTISGAGTIGDINLMLINQGTIDANDSSALVVNTGSNTITNSGTLEATSSGGLDIDSSVSNSKTIEALGTNAKVMIESTITDATTGLVLASGAGAQIDLDNATILGGTLQTSGSKGLIETVSGSNDALDGGHISSGSTVEVNGNTTLTLDSTIDNSGTLLVNGGTLDVAGVLTGGATDISGAGKMVIAQASGESVVFQTGSTGQVVLDQATSYTGEISGFATTQSIDLTDIDFAAGVKINYQSNNRQNTSGVLTITKGTETVHIELAGSYTLANFRVASDGEGGTLLTDPTVINQRPGNASETIGNNTVLEIDTPDKGNVTFSGTTGAVTLDQPATFTGKISGFGSQNAIDLPSIAFGAQTTLGYSPNSNNIGGTLSLTNGAQSANISLLGSYMASSFVMESDSHGGTMVLTDAIQSGNQALLTNPHHA
jgi:hypothetical protein